MAILNRVVTRLAPRRDSFETALAAFRAGDFSFCLDALAHLNGADAISLRARALIRAGRSAEALDVLTGLDHTSLSHRVASELLILQFSAAISCGRSDVAEHAMLDAKGRSYGVASPQLESELRFYSGVFEWSQGRYDAASEELHSLISVESDIPTWLIEDAPSYAFSRGYWVSRAYEALAMISAVRGNFTEQASFLLKAFDEYDRADCIDMRIETSMLSNLAVLVRDLQTPELAKFVAERSARIVWTEPLRDHQFLTLRALGWCSTLGGDHVGGLRHFLKSAEVAPTKPWQIIALLDRAFVARELNEPYFAAEQLDLACALASETTWDTAVGSECYTLLDIARAMADVDVALARRMLDKYRALGTKVSALEVYSKDRRRRAEECYAMAAVAKAEGQDQRAAMLFKEAFHIWSEVGYGWRAGSAALEIYGITGERPYLEVVAREAAARPHSWIARRYAKVVAGESAGFTVA